MTEQVFFVQIHRIDPSTGDHTEFAFFHEENAARQHAEEQGAREDCRSTSISTLGERLSNGMILLNDTL
jgi:hypothetical protein